jgi:UDP-N-acetylmuramate dehydrogenase
MTSAIQEHVDLKPYNTFGIQAFARYFVSIRSTDDLVKLIHTDLFTSQKRLVLGGGSNILFTRNFDGLVIHNDLKGIAVTGETDAHITLTVASGESWHPFVLHCVNHNWGGIENLSLIPGTVGAAPMQNIGAYGVEIKEVVDRVTGIDLLTGQERTFNNDQCQFGYRESIFKHALREKIFISSVTLSLTKKNHLLRTEYGAIQDTLHTMNVTQPTVQHVSDAVIKIRQQKLPDPAVLGNSGSFFKNPVVAAEHYERLLKDYPTMPGYRTENQSIKIPAAWLIEHCGWKGKTINQAGVHRQQALVLVNYGSASGAEILSLSKKIQHDVSEKFKIVLTPEVNII